MKLKKKKSYLSKLKILLIFFLLLLVTFLIIIQKPIEYVSYFFLNYASIAATKEISSIINEESSSEKFTKISYDDLFYVSKNSSNEIEMIDYNLLVVNEILDEITLDIQNKLKEKEEKEFLKIPFGIITNNPFFNNMGPIIPAKLKLISSIQTNINTKLTGYGINNSLIEISVNIKVQAKVILPVISKDIIVTNEVPLSYKIINGKIPEYYGGILSKNSSTYQLPLE